MRGDAVDKKRMELSLSCTAEHPFYIVNRFSFIPAREITIGDEFSLKDGSKAKVTQIEVSCAKPHQKFVTYNLKVENFHTYFIGKVGVWVHNVSDFRVQQIYSEWIRAIELENDLNIEIAIRVWKGIEDEFLSKSSFQQLGKALENVIESLYPDMSIDFL